MRQIHTFSIFFYTWTTEERKYLNFDGHCVEDNLIGIYGPLIKKFTKSKLIELANEFYKAQKLKEQRTEQSDGLGPLDVGYVICTKKL